MRRDARVQPAPRVVPKGIFCLEGDWWGKLHKGSSVEPILDLLHQWDPYYVPYVRRDVATRAEFEYYISRWAQKRMAAYPILYLAFHGKSSEVTIGDHRRIENRVTIAELGDMLEAKCHGRMIYFGSCQTLDLHGNSIQAFLRKTGALAVCGYRRDVEWLDSTAFELVMMSAMQLHSMTRRGAAAMQRRIDSRAPVLARKLRFHMVISKP
jgi:hypothetical protein